MTGRFGPCPAGPIGLPHGGRSRPVSRWALLGTSAPPTPSPRTWSGVHSAARGHGQSLQPPPAARWTPDQVRGDGAFGTARRALLASRMAGDPGPSRVRRGLERRPPPARHPGLGPGSTPRRGDGQKARTPPQRPGGPRNTSGGDGASGTPRRPYLPSSAALTAGRAGGRQHARPHIAPRSAPAAPMPISMTTNWKRAAKRRLLASRSATETARLAPRRSGPDAPASVPGFCAGGFGRHDAVDVDLILRADAEILALRPHDATDDDMMGCAGSRSPYPGGIPRPQWRAARATTYCGS